MLEGPGLALDEPLLDGAGELLVPEGGADDAAGELLATVLPELSPPQPAKMSGTKTSALIASGFKQPWNDMAGME